MGHSQVAVQADSDPEHSTDQPVQKPVSRVTRWYRSALFNVIIVGLISFTQPGIWNALNSRLLCLNFGVDVVTDRDRYRSRWATEALPGQRRQQSHFWHYGLWLSLVCHPCKSLRPATGSRPWNFGVCSLLGISICQQQIRHRMVRSLWWRHLWDCSVCFVVIGRGYRPRIRWCRRSREI
jgi:hypothetical protein